MDAIEAIEKDIRDFEAEQAKRAEFLSDMRAALAKMRNGSAPSQPMAGPPTEGASAPPRKNVAVFERKYDANARDLVFRILPESRKPQHIGQIKAALDAQGKKFIKPTIALALKQLQAKGLVKRVKAPTGSGYTYAWVLTLEKERPTEEPKVGE